MEGFKLVASFTYAAVKVWSPEASAYAYAVDCCASAARHPSTIGNHDSVIMPLLCRYSTAVWATRHFKRLVRVTECARLS
jgi:hypothetical protein